MRYEIIIFDADETLFDFKKSEKEAFRQAIINLNIDYIEDYHLKTYSEINTAIWKEFEQGLITQEKLKVERFKRLSDKLNLNFDANDFAKSYMNFLRDGSFLYENSLELIQDLSKDFKLYIVTNGLTYVQDKRIRQSIMSKYFEDIVISEEILISKPNPEIFEYTLRNVTNLDKSKVLMVGDSLTSDIQGGINFGIDTCWYNPKKLENKTKFKPTYEISSYDELKLLLIE